MGAERDFREAYPVSAKAAVHTPLVFRSGLEALASLPWPSLEGIRDFARFAGVGDGAIRTALSRAKAEGGLIVEKDAAGVNRYRLSPARFAMGMSVIRGGDEAEGFLVAVFSFKSEDGAERAALRDTLKDFGFKKLAQNAYINGLIDTAALRAAVRGLGLEKHLFLFACPDIDDAELVGRILELFDLEARKEELEVYFGLLVAFLPEGLAGDELARRLLYVGPVHYELCEAGEPPFPAKHLPSDYPLARIQAFYGRRLQEGRSAMLEYYIETNG